jgi:hypothetical protein
MPPKKNEIIPAFLRDGNSIRSMYLPILMAGTLRSFVKRAWCLSEEKRHVSPFLNHQNEGFRTSKSNITYKYDGYRMRRITGMFLPGCGRARDWAGHFSEQSERISMLLAE